MIQEELLDTGQVEFTKSGIRKHASYEIINEMVMDTWEHVATDEHILDGFPWGVFFYFDVNM